MTESKNDKVYVVLYDDSDEYSGSLFIAGVFTTRTKAKEYIRDIKRSTYTIHYFNKKKLYTKYYIQSVSLNKIVKAPDKVSASIFINENDEVISFAYNTEITKEYITPPDETKFKSKELYTVTVPITIEAKCLSQKKYKEYIYFYATTKLKNNGVKILKDLKII